MLKHKIYRRLLPHLFLFWFHFEDSTEQCLSIASKMELKLKKGRGIYVKKATSFVLFCLHRDMMACMLLLFIIRRYLEYKKVEQANSKLGLFVKCRRLMVQKVNQVIVFCAVAFLQI